jgi:hypothetical protein
MNFQASGIFSGKSSIIKSQEIFQSDLVSQLLFLNPRRELIAIVPDLIELNMEQVIKVIKATFNAFQVV